MATQSNNFLAKSLARFSSGKPEGRSPRSAEPTTRSRSAWWPRLFWLFIPLLLWWVLKQVPVTTVWQLFAHFSLPAIGLLLVVRGLIILVLSSRWQLFLKTLGYAIPHLTMMGYNLIGFGLSYFTPGPQWGGEPVQIYLVKQRHEVSTAHSIAALTLDKLLAWLSQGTLLLVGLGLLLLNDFGQGWGWQGLGPAIGLVAIPTAYLVALWRGRQPFTALLGLLPARFKRKGQAVATDAEAQIGDFCRHQTSVFWQGVFLSFVVWPLLLGLEFWLALHFLGVTLNISQVLIILAASRIAMFMPLPAGLGILEASQVLIMPLLGLDPAVGIALSFLIRARDLLMGGFGLLWGTMLWSRPH